ncbi:MAG: cellulase family glycosylhydrolase, partial [Cetobacterium sp.]
MQYSSAIDYVAAMGVGFNSDACKTKPARKAVYDNPVYYQRFAEKGFKHIRLRVTNNITYDQYDDKGVMVGGEPLAIEIERAVNNSIAAGLMPIVAYKGGQLEENSTLYNEDQFVEWWMKCSDRLAHFDNRVAFNLLIEIGNPLQKHPEVVNRVYSRVIDYVRESQPYRVIFCAPVMLSEPRKLNLLVLPENDPFIAVEVHDFASGPSKIIGNSKYWNEVGDPDAYRDSIQKFTDTVDYAYDWSNQTDIPAWWGAILSAPYNKEGGSYTPLEQAHFAEIVMAICDGRDIPVAWNSDDKFIDMATMTWLPEQEIVLNLITG